MEVSVSESRVLICLLVCVPLHHPQIGGGGNLPSSDSYTSPGTLSLINSFNRHLLSTYHICELESP